MIDALTKLLLKTSGFFTAFIFACENLKLSKVHTCVGTVTGNPFQEFIAQATFAALCVVVIIVGYFIVSDIAKTSGELLAYLIKQHKEKDNTHLEILSGVVNTLKYMGIIPSDSQKSENSYRVESPRTTDTKIPGNSMGSKGFN